MKREMYYAVAVMFVTVATWGQGIRSAGELFVYLDATNVTGVADDAYVTSWPNSGTLAEFVPAMADKGATFASSVGGSPALAFNGTTESTMVQLGHTSHATAGGVPASILGTNIWSAETWVYNPAGGSTIETLLAWTSRRVWIVRTMMEMRYFNTTDAVEHFAGNLLWGGKAPAFGQWHHVACVRDENLFNSLYVDGQLVYDRDMGGKNMLNLNPTNALFSIGAVDSTNDWIYPLSGAIAVVRVHNGALSPEDVLHNFMVERSRFGGGWQNTGAGAWNEPTNWENNSIPAQDAPLYLNNGGTAIYNGVPYADNTDTVMLLSKHGTLDIAGGTFNALPFLMYDTYLRLAIEPAKSFTLKVSGGNFATGTRPLVLGDAANSTGTVSLASGGRLTVPRIQKGTGKAFLTADGGTLAATVNSSTFLQGLDSATVKAGGIAFDVAENAAIRVAQPLIEDENSRGGGLAKGGAGMLTLTGANTITGELAVTGGRLLIQSGTLPTAFASPVTLSNDADITWDQTGGAATIAEHLTEDSTGFLTLYSSNANDDLDLSALSNVTWRTYGTFDYNGTLTPYANLYRFTPDNGTVDFAQQIIDLPGTAGRVEVLGTPSGSINFSGDSSYTGGTLLGAGSIIMSHANALGIGTAGVRDIVCSNGTALKVRVPLNDANFFERVDAESYVSLQLDDAGLENNIDLSNCPNLFTGTGTTSKKSYFKGTLTPYGNTYLLGNSGVDPGDWLHGFVITNLTDAPGGAPRNVLIKGVGAVDTRENADYSGGTRVEDGGKIIVIGDRGFGSVPAVFDPTNIVFSNSGVLRTETRNITLAPTRGIVFESGTTRIHASGALPAQFKIPGDITGTGNLRLTDIGWVVFAGTNNTYNGNIQLTQGWNPGATVMIGDGAAFSWASTNGIEGVGAHSCLYLNNNDDVTFNDTFSGKGTLFKKGDGTLTLAGEQTHMHNPVNTLIEAGTLRYGVQHALPSGAGYGIVAVWPDGRLDVNGFAVTLNGLGGGGTITNSAETAVALTVGSDAADSSFSGTFAKPLSLTKIGGNALALTHQNPTREPVTAAAGTLVLGNGTALTNGITIGNGALVQANGYQGLRGEYYDDLFPKGGDYKWPALDTTMEAVDALLAGILPNLVIGSESFGEFFDSTANGANFPDKYNGPVDYFVTRWSGMFMAESAGLYAFKIRADDGCMLFLDGELVVNNRSGGGTTFGSVTLTEGTHAIMIFFYEKGGDQIIRVYMTPPGGSETLLPQNLLSTAPTTVADINGAKGSQLGTTDYARLDIIQTNNVSIGSFSGADATHAIITKQGAGILTLIDTSSFSGTTRITDGGITLTHGISHTGAFDVVNGALFLSGGMDVDATPVLIGSLNVAAAGEVTLGDTTVLLINQTTDGRFAGTLAGGTTESLIAKSGPAELIIESDLSAYPGAWAVFNGDLVIAFGDGGKIAENASIETRAGGAIVFRCHTNRVFTGAISGTGAVRNEGPGTLTLTGAVSSNVEVAEGQTIILDSAAVSGIETFSGAFHNEGTLVFTTPGILRLKTPITGNGEVRVGAETSLLVNQGGLANNQNMLLDGGSLLLNNGGTLGFDDTMWVTTGVSHFVIDDSGDTILELNPNQRLTMGAAYYRDQLRTVDPWTIDLTFHQGEHNGNNAGDGFGVFFQNDPRGTEALPTAWWTVIRPYSPSFGFQYYLMPNDCYLAWAEDGVLFGKVETNLFAQLNGEFTARMTFDGTKMVVDMQQGATTYSMTNLNAGARLATVGTNAWLGIVGGTGGAYGQQFIDDFAFAYTEEQTRSFPNDITLAAGTTSQIETASSMDAALPLTIGDITFNTDAELKAVPASGTDPNSAFLKCGNLNIMGDSSLAIDPAAQVVLGGDTWSFTLGAVLKITGIVTLPPTVHIVIDGEIPSERMNLIDFRNAEIVNLEEVTFVIDDDDGKTQVIYRAGWLYTIRTQGTLMILR